MRDSSISTMMPTPPSCWGWAASQVAHIALSFCKKMFEKFAINILANKISNELCDSLVLLESFFGLTLYHSTTRGSLTFTHEMAWWFGTSFAQHQMRPTTLVIGSLEFSKKEPDLGHIFLPLWDGHLQPWVVWPLDILTHVMTPAHVGHTGNVRNFSEFWKKYR